jgi:hypothetical protein
MRTPLLPVGLLLAVIVAAGCPDAPPTPPVPPPPGGDGLEAMAQSAQGKLLWKRGVPLSRGLATALFVPVDEACRELGRFDCVQTAHQVPLGGNDAFVRGQYTPLLEPGATTAVAFDRLAMSVCVVAVDRDRARPAPVLFRGHTLSDEPLDPASEDAREGALFLGRSLYEQLHARAPRDAELELLLELLTDDEGAGVSGRDFAVLACFAVASTTETLFY